MIKALLDTDILLDFFFDRQPYSDEASVVLSLCESNRMEGFVTPVIVSNLYYLLRKTASHALVINKLKLLMSIVDVLSIDKRTVLQALNSPFKDFEDALQNYAAESSQAISVIITRNIKDYKNSALSVQTPVDFIKMTELY